VVPAIWQALDHHGGPALVKKIRKQVSRSLAEHYRAKINSKTPEARLRRLVELLREEGVLAGVANENGKAMLYKRSCPFISMFDDEQTVCAIDLDMISFVVEHPVRRVKCRHEGAPCCAFELEPE
jgi:predicted ArsR family transcriptional regulator